MMPMIQHQLAIEAATITITSALLINLRKLEDYYQ